MRQWAPVGDATAQAQLEQAELALHQMAHAIEEQRFEHVLLELASTPREIKAVLERTLTLCLEAMGAECGFITTLDGNGLIEDLVTWGMDTPNASTVAALPIDRALLIQCFTEERPLVAQNPHKHALCAPLVKREPWRIVDPNDISPEESRELSAIPNTGAIEVLLYLEGRPTHESFAECDRWVEVLHEPLQQYIHESHHLRAFELQTQNMTMTLQAIRAPQSVHMSLAQSLIQETLSSTEVHEIGKDLEASAQSIMYMIDDTLSTWTPECSFNIQRVDLAQHIANDLPGLEIIAAAQGRHIRAHGTSEPVFAETEPRIFVAVIHKLFTNAIRSSAIGSTIQITLNTRETPGPKSPWCWNYKLPLNWQLKPLENCRWVEISIHSPVQCSPSDLQQLQGNLTNASATVRALGRFLPMIANTVRKLGGDLWLTTSQSQGTCIKFTLPTRVAQKRDAALAFWQ